APTCPNNDRAIDYDKLECKLNETLGQLAQKDIEIKGEIIDNAAIKHSKDQFRAPTAQDMEIQIQTCLMPLALKTQNDSFIFVHELKQEMHDDLNKEVHTQLLQCFAKVEKHSISLEIALKKCKEQVKSDTFWNEQASNVFQKEREQYKEIQDLKAQLQDKNIAISELKKLIEKGRGKSVETKFDKPSVVRQPNAQRIPKPSVLGKPAPLSKSLERRYFSKTKSVPKTNVSEGLLKPVTTQTLPQTTRKAKDVVIGLPKLKFIKDQLCSSCELSKAKRISFKSKSVLSSEGRLNLLYMDLCGPMRVASINGKKYILVIIDDYSRYTWNLFLHSKDETP
nr:Gag-Pol polyprotein [Tanacetum cinerariifolium]